MRKAKRKAKTVVEKEPILVINPTGVMTRREVAEYLGVGKSRVFALIKGGVLIGVKTYYGTDQFFTLREVKKVQKMIRPYVKIKGRLCPTCKKNPATKPHKCPYKTEIDNNDEKCTCCEDCQHACRDEV